jgi:hypothetical protein
MLLPKLKQKKRQKPSSALSQALPQEQLAWVPQ